MNYVRSSSCRQDQIEGASLYPNNAPRWRKFLEPDILTATLAGEEIWTVLSIRAQLAGPNVSFNVVECTMFFLPTIFDFGWCLYAWDMHRKIINIFDPSYGNFTTQRRKNLLEAVADKLHVAFFSLIYKLFSNWKVDCIRWEKKIPRDIAHHSRTVSLLVYSRRLLISSAPHDNQI
ncbi:hypothetical protein ZWY2020_025451 [Hordeum vulgare]|nr:hypothetical protein ZWY2020_025451 [Hordeum vulgare]